MTRSPPSDSPPPVVRRSPEFPAFEQFGLAEPWSMDGLDFDIERILAGYETHLAGLTQEQQAGPYLARKLAKKRRRPATDYQHSSPIPTPHTQAVMPSWLPLYNFKPESEAMRGRMNPGSEDDDELDALFLEAACLASLEQVANETDTLDGGHLRTETPIPTISNTPHLMAHARSPTPPVDYNAHGCITARSKGKGWSFECPKPCWEQARVGAQGRLTGRPSGAPAPLLPTFACLFGARNILALGSPMPRSSEQESPTLPGIRENINLSGSTTSRILRNRLQVGRPHPDLSLLRAFNRITAAPQRFDSSAAPSSHLLPTLLP
ncbi:hypothetical protein FRC08_001490 [Ceratobasidium sp. 394]|nr:hypothetical protein FRC08_001490 [Ceratobasidium sp. 394]